MRTRWVTGSATDVDGNYPGRYCTPWREDGDVLLPDGTGPDNPRFYPFDQMTTRQFVAAMARVYSWEVEWAASFHGPAYSNSFGGIFEVVPTATFPEEGGDAELGINQEHRWGGGFSWSATEDVPTESGEASVSFRMGGRHQYQLPGAIQQRFRPLLIFSFTLNFDQFDNGNWSILSKRQSTESIGSSLLSFSSVDADTEDTYFPPYSSQQGMNYVGISQSILIGPATVSAELTIRPKRWWPHRDGLGADPIYDVTSGAKLRSTRSAPSTQVVGQVVAAGLSGTRFVA